MNNTFLILEQKSKTKNLDANLIFRRCLIDLVFIIVEIKSNNPKVTQKQIEQLLSYSDSTIKTYRHQIDTPNFFKR